MLLFSPSLVLLAVLGLASIFSLIRRLGSPLQKLPGPFLSRFTSLILRVHELRASRTPYIHRLHLKYGPAVRIAPNQVAFASLGAVKEIYASGGSGYDKTEFYDLFKVYGRRWASSSPD